MRDFLSQKGVDFEERDFFKETFSTAEIRGLAGGSSISQLFSWRSPSVKTMGLEGRKLSEDELVGLMIQEPRLIRRPLVRIGERLIIGANWKELEEVLR